jgi:hypothetical protein
MLTIGKRMQVRALHPRAQLMSTKKQAEEASGLSPLELARIVPIPEAVRLSSLSEETLRRKHRDKWIQLSERRYGMRLRDVLMLSK